MSQDKRKFTRVSVKVLTETTAAGEDIGFFGRIRDISLRGAFILGLKGFEKDSFCTLEIILGEPGNDKRIVAKCVVTRVEEEGIGIQFESVESAGLPHLINLVLKNAEVPGNVIAELDSVLGVKAPDRREQ